jgi:hypothetical protein
MTQVKPRMMLLPHAVDLPAPAEHATELDLVAAIPVPVVIAPGQRAAIPTGLVVALPPGFEGQIRPRAGLYGAQFAGHRGCRLSRRDPGRPDQSGRGTIHRRAWHPHRAIRRRAGAGPGLRMAVTRRMAVRCRDLLGSTAMTLALMLVVCGAIALAGAGELAAAVRWVRRKRRWRR